MAKRSATKTAPSRPRKRRGAKPAAPTGFFRRTARLVLRVALLIVLVPVLWVSLYRWVDPPGGAYMASEWMRLGGITHQWRAIGDISPHMARAAMAAEDANFCDHWGFDFAAIQQALEDREAGRQTRGASTISQQVAKNVFLWHGRSWLRKGLEAGFTVLVEAIWPKRRIVEVYLNVAEFDAGVFGVGAASWHHFDRPAADLSLAQSSRLAAILPNPKERSATNPSAFVRKRAASIARGAETLRVEKRDGCVFDRG